MDSVLQSVHKVFGGDGELVQPIFLYVCDKPGLRFFDEELVAPFTWFLLRLVTKPCCSQARSCASISNLWCGNTE